MSCRQQCPGMPAAERASDMVPSAADGWGLSTVVSTRVKQVCAVPTSPWPVSSRETLMKCWPNRAPALWGQPPSTLTAASMILHGKLKATERLAQAGRLPQDVLHARVLIMSLSCGNDWLQPYSTTSQDAYSVWLAEV